MDDELDPMEDLSGLSYAQLQARGKLIDQLIVENAEKKLRLDEELDELTQADIRWEARKVARKARLKRLNKYLFWSSLRIFRDGMLNGIYYGCCLITAVTIFAVLIGYLNWFFVAAAVCSIVATRKSATWFLEYDEKHPLSLNPEDLTPEARKLMGL